ncbi:MAG TPA: SDR family NAD(P)-dependent oxidoreductase [Pseudogracilibacillus sp.]|nr:SDR family NAD(P)-dependent oxidoreductase [Pseudogracilibacillus sp.]
MELSGNTVLITGGTSGIGFAFAKRFINAGNTVIVCGRDEEKLHETKRQFPSIITRVCDVAHSEDRKALFEWITTHYPDVNALVNNAGMLKRFNMLEVNAVEEWEDYSKEITTNQEGAIHIAMMFAPYFAKKENAFMINITSFQAFTPDPFAPIYAATKAAIHSFTISLRHQLSKTPVKIVEVAPPLVNTSGYHDSAVPTDEFVEKVFQDLQQGKLEIGYGSSEASFRLSRDEIDENVKQIFQKKNNESFGS